MRHKVLTFSFDLVTWEKIITKPQKVDKKASQECEVPIKMIRENADFVSNFFLIILVRNHSAQVFQ